MPLLELWGSEITDAILELARSRILDGGNLATKTDRRTAKMALILVRRLNPEETLTQEEEAILAGVARGTLRKLKSESVKRQN